MEDAALKSDKPDHAPEEPAEGGAKLIDWVKSLLPAKDEESKSDDSLREAIEELIEEEDTGSAQSSVAGHERKLIANILQLRDLPVLDVMVPLPGSTYRVTNPSVSPENVHPHGATVCAGPMMDTQIARDLFTRTLDAATRLDRDTALREELEAALTKLVPHRVGHAGERDAGCRKLSGGTRWALASA